MKNVWGDSIQMVFYKDFPLMINELENTIKEQKQQNYTALRVMGYL